jgi:hypothetical protein
MTACAFYCTTDARHYLGAVGLLNSLRLVGHREPFVVCDCGLTQVQREELAPHAEVIAAPEGIAPMMLKPVAPLARPADVMVILDADVIVTRSLAPFIEMAASGKIVAFANDNPHRHFPEWGELLEIAAPRRQTYVASGHLFVDSGLGRTLLERFVACQARIDVTGTLLSRGSTPANPFHYPDMDVLNAVLASEFAPEDLVAADYRLAPHAPFAGVRLVDPSRLRCTYRDGTEPYVLHHVLRKPWLARTARNIYSLLLPRLLLGEDVQLRIARADVPLRLRTGRLARADRRLSDLQAAASPYVRGNLGIRPRLEDWRAAKGRA